MTRRFLPGLFIALGVLALGLIVAFTVGRYPVTLAELADVLLSRVTGRPSTAPAAVENVVLLVRGPRVLAAVMVGAALAVAGTAFQGLFRNPLVSPDILGASSGAALGAVLGIYFSLGVIGIESLAFVGGLVAVAAVYVIGSLLQARDPDPGPGAYRRRRWRAARRRHRAGEVSRRSLQPASCDDLLAARQSRRHHRLRSRAARWSGGARYRRAGGIAMAIERDVAAGGRGAHARRCRPVRCASRSWSRPRW